MRFHLLFEQSGTFKNVLKENGHEVYDYDILNDFGETDFQIDLFNEIEKCYESIISDNINTGAGVSIFSKMKQDEDFIIAFFPCTHFSGLNQLQYKLCAGKKFDFDRRAIKRLIKRNKERAKYFELYMKFCFIVKELKIKTIIENPAGCLGNPSYLELFSPIEIGYKEKDRSKFGDLYVKPTNFFAINFKMEETFIMYTPTYHKKNIATISGMTKRSMITKEYAKNFYKRFLEQSF